MTSQKSRDASRTVRNFEVGDFAKGGSNKNRADAVHRCRLLIA